MVWSADLSLVGLLALLTLLDGIRRVPEGAVLLRRTFAAEWHVVAIEGRRALRLVSWWPPVVTTLVLAPHGSVLQQAGVPVSEQIAGMTPWLMWLRLGGGAVLVSLVVGLPILLRSYGTTGFLIALAVVVGCSVATSAIAFLAHRRLGNSTRAAAWWAVPFLSPFSAPRAAEALLEESVRGYPPAVVAQQLLSPDKFLRWLRPRAYDLRHRAPHADASLLAGLDSAALAHALDPRESVDPDASLWCARCGAAFLHGTTCPDCGVELSRVGERA